MPTEFKKELVIAIIPKNKTDAEATASQGEARSTDSALNIKSCKICLENTPNPIAHGNAIITIKRNRQIMTANCHFGARKEKHLELLSEIMSQNHFGKLFVALIYKKEYHEQRKEIHRRRNQNNRG